MKIRDSVMIIIGLFFLWGNLSHEEFVDQVRSEFQKDCPNGVVDVKGDTVTCTEEENLPRVIGVIK